MNIPFPVASTEIWITSATRLSKTHQTLNIWYSFGINFNQRPFYFLISRPGPARQSAGKFTAWKASRTVGRCSWFRMVAHSVQVCFLGCKRMWKRVLVIFNWCMSDPNWLKDFLPFQKQSKSQIWPLCQGWILTGRCHPKWPRNNGGQFFAANYRSTAGRYPTGGRIGFVHGKSPARNVPRWGTSSGRIAGSSLR